MGNSNFVISKLCSNLLAYPKKQLSTRQEEIHQRGSQVMPFDLDKTTHYFQPTDTGEVMEIKAKNAADQDQIKLICLNLLLY